MKRLRSFLGGLILCALPSPSRAAEIFEHHDWTLICAIYTNDEAAVRAALEHGANANASVEGKQTALSVAVDRASREIVQMLIDRGAKPDAHAIKEARPALIPILAKAG